MGESAKFDINKLTFILKKNISINTIKNNIKNCQQKWYKISQIKH